MPTKIKYEWDKIMKIQILTQPLLNNYGGMLQNYALQMTLKKWGHIPCTMDWFPPLIPVYKYLFSWLKTILFRVVGKKRFFVKRQKLRYRNSNFNNFADSFIEKTNCNRSIAACLSNDVDAVIVGSDQVWRPKYNYSIEDMYLKCAEKRPIKRIAYAASFGVDSWEYTPTQTFVCRKLAKQFDAISVREESGVRLCKDYLDVDATWVLDPTLLLSKEDYLPICEDVPICNEKYLAVYVLDENENVTSAYEKEANKRGLIVKKFKAGFKSTLSVPEWLAMFRDASYVVTDSFHGTVFSIIFGKEFKCIFNKKRGSARFESLIKLYNLGKLEEMREFSINWLKNALEN